MHTGMLRESAASSDTDLDLRSVTDLAVPPLLPAGEALRSLPDALLGSGDVAAVRGRIIAEVGVDGFLDALAVVANFEMMNRVADAVGTPVGKGTLHRTEQLRREAGLDAYRRH